MNAFLRRNSDGSLDTQVVVAIIGGVATVLAAVIAGVLGLLPFGSDGGPPVAEVTPPTSNRISAEPTPAGPPPTDNAPTDPTPTDTARSAVAVEIDGPSAAPLGSRTFFTIISPSARRVEWAIAGFGSGAFDDFAQTEQVYVEPTDPERVGDEFVLVVTAYDVAGFDATTRHTFVISPAD